jgi:hypothetical protein
MGIDLNALDPPHVLPILVRGAIGCGRGSSAIAANLMLQPHIGRAQAKRSVSLL